MALLYFINKKQKLVLYDDLTNQTLISFDYSNDDIKEFSVEFIHSVNKSPVIEFYQFNSKNEIFVTKCIYYNFGAGVETELENEEVLTYGDDGSMIVDSINRKINNLIYTVGTIYDHILKINDKQINLSKEFGKNRKIRFEIK